MRVVKGRKTIKQGLVMGPARLQNRMEGDIVERT
jgi:hypothetical protein